MINNSRRCLFSYGHAAGRYVQGAGAFAYENLFRQPISVKGRNLTGQATDNKLDIALVMRAGAGTKVKFESNATGDTAEITSIVEAATPTLFTLKNALDYEADGDVIYITVYVSSTEHIEIKTLTLWEQQRGTVI
jgi:hypothetical protein